VLPAFISHIFSSCDRTSGTRHALACNAYHIIAAPRPYDIQTTCHLYDLCTYPMFSPLLTYDCELQYLPLAQFAVHMQPSIPLWTLTSELWVPQPQFLVLCWWPVIAFFIDKFASWQYIQFTDNSQNQILMFLALLIIINFICGLMLNCTFNTKYSYF